MGIPMRLLALLIFALYITDARASSNAGIEIDLGKFHLKVYYSVAVDYDQGADRFIRDPGYVLFDLASSLQANMDDISRIEHTVQVDLDMYTGKAGNFLSIIEDPQDNTVVLASTAAEDDIAKQILKVICSRYSGACKRPASGRVNLYLCGKTACPGQIRFGSFPSSSINGRYGLVMPSGIAVKHLSVTRKRIRQYYETLEP